KPIPGKKKAEDFEFGKLIGEGSYSTVVLARDKKSHKEYAVKILEKRLIIKEHKVKYVSREKEVFSRLNHPFFVRLYFTFQDKERLYFVLSFAKNGELLNYINKLGSFDEYATRFYAAEITSALEYLHDQGIIHRDLKPENILLDNNMHIQITDFGTAFVEGDDNARAQSFVGTAQYVSPELLTAKSAFKSSDLWALGCIIYQFAAGLPPFRATNEYQIFQKIINLEYNFPDGFDPTTKELVECLLVKDPKQRLGCPEMGGYSKLKAHTFYEDIPWEKLADLEPPKLAPFLPAKSKSQEDLRGDDDDDFDERMLAQFGLSDKERNKEFGLLSNINKEDRKRKLDKQQKDSKWHRFVENNLILKMGLVDKRKGLFARRRQLLLTEGPHLYYVDPQAMVLKGEIPWSRELRPEAKNFKTFFVHTPNRTYYLEDPNGYAIDWVNKIEDVHKDIYQRSASDSVAEFV
ncbi:uncharacterized protein TRIADDRAFT_31577, partial [Trichoplax adhaerens]